MSAVAVNPVSDLITLLEDNIDYTSLKHYNVSTNPTASLQILPLTDNNQPSLVNSDLVLIYEAITTRDTSDYFTKKAYHRNSSLQVHILAREEFDEANHGGLKAVAAEVMKVLEKYYNWKKQDATANFDHIEITNEKNLSDKRKNFFKMVISLELHSVGVNRSSI